MCANNRGNRTMKAAVVNEFKQILEIKEVLVPELECGEIFEKTKACGVCPTGLYAAHGDWVAIYGMEVLGMLRFNMQKQWNSMSLSLTFKTKNLNWGGN